MPFVSSALLSCAKSYHAPRASAQSEDKHLINASRTNERWFRSGDRPSLPVSKGIGNRCYLACCSAVGAAGAAGVCDGCFAGASLFGSAGRITRARSDSISCKLIGHNERGGSGAAAVGFGEPADAVDAPADASAAGIFSVGFVSAAAGVFSNGTAAAATVVSLDGVPPSWGAGKLVLCAGGVSILPRMSGKPSFALPMITTFEFVDCAS